MRCTAVYRSRMARSTDTVTIRLPRELADCIEDEADRQGLSRNAVIVLVLKREYEKAAGCQQPDRATQA